MTKKILWSKNKGFVAQTITTMIEKMLLKIPEGEKTTFETKMTDRVKKASIVFVSNLGEDEFKKLYFNNREILSVADIKTEKSIEGTRHGLSMLFSLLPPEMFAHQHAVLKKEAWYYFQEWGSSDRVMSQGYKYMMELNKFYSTNICCSPISPKLKKEKKRRDKSKKQKKIKNKKLSKAALHRIEQRQIIKKKLAEGVYGPDDGTKTTSVSALMKIREMVKKEKEKR